MRLVYPPSGMQEDGRVRNDAETETVRQILSREKTRGEQKPKV